VTVVKHDHPSGQGRTAAAIAVKRPPVEPTQIETQAATLDERGTLSGIG
jgi:hypothetical protein